MHKHEAGKQFARYVIPAVIGMVVQALYVVLDGVIVGQGIGELALAAINIAFPIGMVVIALAMLIAVGAANVSSFYKGQGNLQKANEVFNLCLALTVLVGALLSVGGFILREPLALLFGADETLLPSTIAYLSWLAPLSLLQMAVCFLATLIRNDDAPKRVMLATVSGALVNVALDILFILILGYGIEWTAITNGMGMFIELCFYIAHFAAKKGMLRLKRPRFSAADLKRVLSNGFATFLMELSLPAVTLSFNLAIIHTVGTLGVTAYAIVGYVCALINMTLIGVTQGAQPLMSLCHGSGDKAAFRQVYRLGVRTNLIVPAVLVGLFVLLSGPIVSLFGSTDPALVEMTERMMRLYPLAHLAIGLTLMNILYFQTTERNAFSSLISFLRCVGFIQVFLLLSVFAFDGRGLYLAFLLGEGCHLALSQLLVVRAARAEAAALPPEAP